MKPNLEKLLFFIIIIFSIFLLYFNFFTDKLNFLNYIFGFSFKFLPLALIIISLINIFILNKKIKNTITSTVFLFILLPIFIKINTNTNLKETSLFERYLKVNNISLILFNISFILNLIYLIISLIDLVDYIYISKIEHKVFNDDDDDEKNNLNEYLNINENENLNEKQDENEKVYDIETNGKYTIDENNKELYYEIKSEKFKENEKENEIKENEIEDNVENIEDPIFQSILNERENETNIINNKNFDNKNLENEIKEFNIDELEELNNKNQNISINSNINDNINNNNNTDNYDNNDTSNEEKDKIIHNNLENNKNLNLIKNLFNKNKNKKNINYNDSKSLEEVGNIIIKTLRDFNIEASIINYIKGPTVTRFELAINEKVNLVKIEKLKKNIAYNLSASKIRILAPIPGKKAVGIEVPNEEKEIVYFDEIFLNNYENITKQYELPVILGKDISGKDWIIDLTQTPHLLIAGRTGSGKSVCINSLICSLISLKTPDELNLILIDPKRVELSLYENLPHNLCEVIIDPDLASKALKWLIIEMERRYEILKNERCRDIKSYNEISENKLPYLILIIDEFYSLMQVAQKQIEESLIRLSSMSRAVGIHLIFATQRPSSDVITGIIKSNLPSRIAFQTTSKIDSRIILDENGAEELLGNGDMLFSFTGYPPVRIQGAFIRTEEVKNIVEKILEIYSNYPKKNIIKEINSIEKKFDTDDDILEDDPLFEEALQIVKEEKKVSASYLQRRLKIGFNRAARIIEMMEEKGYISKIKSDKSRDIFI